MNVVTGRSGFQAVRSAHASLPHPSFVLDAHYVISSRMSIEAIGKLLF